MAQILNGDRQIPVVGGLGIGTVASVMNVVGGGTTGVQTWRPLGTNDEKNVEGWWWLEFERFGDTRKSREFYEMVADESDGWEFWSRVYSNPVLKQQMDEKAQVWDISKKKVTANWRTLQCEPSIRQLLQQEHLCQAELIFLNVPRLVVHERKGAVRQLIEKEVGGGNVPMLDIQVAPKRW